MASTVRQPPSLFLRLREIIALELEAESEAMFGGEIDVDESYFGGKRKGTRHRRSSGTFDRKLAEGLAAKWVREGFMEEHFSKKPDLSFSEVLLNYARAQKRDHTRNFMDTTRYRIKILSERFKGYQVSDFTYGAVQEYADEWLETVFSATVLRDMAIVKAAIKKARREGLTDFVPNFPRLKPSQPRNRWITAEEENRLVAAAAKHLKPLIRFAADTGGRRSELLELDWKQVDLKGHSVTFRKTKNGEDRTVRLCDRAHQTLIGLGPRDSGPVFTYRGKATKCIKTSFDRARDKAGIEDLRFHDLRHTFASRLVQGGVPLYNVMRLTGHKSLTMVQRYAHLAPDFQEGAIHALDLQNATVSHISGTNENAKFAEEGLSL